MHKDHSRKEARGEKSSARDDNEDDMAGDKLGMWRGKSRWNGEIDTKSGVMEQLIKCENKKISCDYHFEPWPISASYSGCGAFCPLTGLCNVEPLKKYMLLHCKCVLSKCNNM